MDTFDTQEPDSKPFGVQHTKSVGHRKTKKRRYVSRQTRRFQLRNDVAEDQHVAEILDFAKSQKREVTMIRKAIALYWSLENGDLSLLHDMFPFTKTAGGAGELDEIKGLLEIIVSQQKANTGYQMASLPADSKPHASGLKPLAVPKVERPVFEDDDDDLPALTFSKATEDCGQNFMRSVSGLVN